MLCNKITHGDKGCYTVSLDDETYTENCRCSTYLCNGCNAKRRVHSCYSEENERDPVTEAKGRSFLDLHYSGPK
jgi:plasmid rolling circle replication initiator protein Rep